jgi:hypothetical protein
MSTTVGKYTILERVTRSTTAIRLGLDNNPGPKELEAIHLLAEKIYDPLCNHFKRTIPFTSWFRSQAVNAVIGGARRSQHVTGEAVDLDVDGIGGPLTNSAIFYYIFHNLPFDQLIWEFGDDRNPAWVHVSYSATRQRKEVLKIKSRESGYEPFEP